ncbi:hypothetical protein [Pseudomonas sp. SMN5]|uniref:hypothetical protein n=1 Tax=Pseudomonas sp. SMN5 TaxID=3390198 RepID=UPI003F87E1B3
MISLELSSIQQKDTDRTWLAQAMDGYLAKGRVIEVVPISRSLFNPTPFNSEKIAPSAASEKSPAQRNFAIRAAKEAKKKAYQADIAEKMKAYHHKGICAAAKGLGISARTARRIADAFGVRFSRITAKEGQTLAPRIKAMILEGLTQEQMCAELDITRAVLKRIASENGLRFRCPSALARDRALVVRIKAIRDIGCSRAACARRLEINPKVLLRLIAEYEISYPLHGEAPEAA